MKALRVLVLAAALGAAPLALVSGCAGEDEQAQPAPGEVARFLEAARAAHLRADEAEAAGKPGDALGALEAVVATAAPDAMSMREREAFCDLVLRVAELRSAAGDHDAARRYLATGLARAPEGGVWRGRLYEAEGVVVARQARELGTTPAAAEARRGALDAFERAVAAQDAVLAAAARPVGSEPVVDEPLLAFVSKARALQHAADLHEQEGKNAEAIRQIRRLVDGPEPPDARTPEVREIEADALARLGELESAGGRYDAASQAVERGLERAIEITHFRGRLYDVLGLVEERRAEALKQAGDARGAAAATERALRASEQAVAIQGEVIERALGGE